MVLHYPLFLFMAVRMEMQMTTPPIPEPPQHASTYLSLLMDVGPLILAAFMIGIMRGWAGLKSSYLHESVFSTICNIVVSSAVMAAFAVGLVLALPYFGVNVTPSGQLGIVLLVSSVGMKSTDEVVKHLFGLKTIDPSSRSSLEKVKAGMTPQQKKSHMDACPFYNDCVENKCDKNCDKCPKGENDAKDIRETSRL